MGRDVVFVAVPDWTSVFGGDERLYESEAGFWRFYF
jgi:hypothetical protein